MNQADNLTARKVALEEERRKIVRLMKNWTMRFENSIVITVSVEEIKLKWDRLKEIDLEISTEEFEVDNTNQQFMFLINKFMSLSNQHNQLSAPEKNNPIKINKQPLKDNTNNECINEQMRLSNYLNTIIKRLQKNETIKRSKLFKGLSDFLAISAMLGQINVDLVDSVVAKAAPTENEIRLIERNYPILHQHLLHTSPAMSFRLASKRVHCH